LNVFDDQHWTFSDEMTLPHGSVVELVGPLTNWSSGHSGYNRELGDFCRNNGARRDDRSSSYLYPRQDQGPGANEDKIFDLDPECSTVKIRRMDIMVCGQNMYLWRDANIRSNFQPSTGVKSTTLVYDGIFSNYEMSPAIKP
jgi:hypothetical protein